MSSDVYLDKAFYSFRNSICWGLCKHHLEKSRTQTEWKGKTIQIILFILEAPPFISQIVSLVEWAIFQLSSVKKDHLPAKPVKTCRPLSQRLEISAGNKELCRFWPQDPSILQLTDKQKDDLISTIREACKNGNTVSCGKKSIIYGRSQDLIEKKLPLTILIDKPSKKGYRCLLFPKTVFATGGEKKIRWIYDLTSGEFLLKKRITGFFERTLIDKMSEHRQLREVCTSSPIYRKVDLGKNKLAKIQHLEEIKDGNLSILFETEPLKHFTVKKQLILDLLEELSFFHSLKTTKNQVSVYGRSLEAYSMFHLDLKPENILVSLLDDKWRAEIADFGNFAGNPVAKVISIGYTSPEYIKFYQNQNPQGLDFYEDQRESIVTFNLKYGCKRDLWAMGLVILSILIGKNHEVEWQEEHAIKWASVPALPCFKKHLVPSNETSWHKEVGLLNITQQMLDKDLALLQKEILRSHKNASVEIKTLFQCVAQMLKVDPDQRIGAATLLSRIKDCLK